MEMGDVSRLPMIASQEEAFERPMLQKIPKKTPATKGPGFDVSFKLTKEEKAKMEEKLKNILQSDEFQEKVVDFQPSDDFKSPLKSSTTFKILPTTPDKVECDFKFGLSGKKFKAKASNLERVSRMFEEIDDDLIPGETTEDIVEDEDIQTQTEKSKTLLQPIKKIQNLQFKKTIKSHVKYKFVDRPVKSKDINQSRLPSPGRKRTHKEIEGESSDQELSKEPSKKKSKSCEEDQGVIFQFGMKQLEDKLKKIELKFDINLHPKFIDQVPSISKLVIEADCMCKEK
jgi:hypothetical protein